MVDVSEIFILLNGEPKGHDIYAFESLGYKGYRVRFRRNPKAYHYSRDKVTILRQPERLKAS